MIDSCRTVRAHRSVGTVAPDARATACRRWLACAVGFLSVLVGSAVAAPSAPPDYGMLKKYLQGRMYPEAYLEVMRIELKTSVPDEKVVKLKRDLLPRVKREAVDRAKVDTRDAGLQILLADIAYQESRLDDAIRHLDVARRAGKIGAIGHSLSARVYYQKRMYDQAFDEISVAVKYDPGSEVLFQDFTFLYNCKNYGLSAARNLDPAATWPKRVEPLISKAAGPPDNPYANDPTRPPTVVNPPPKPPVTPPITTVTVPDDPDEPDEPDGSGEGSDQTEPPDVPPDDDPDDPGSGEPDDTGTDTGLTAGHGSPVAPPPRPPVRPPTPPTGSGSGPGGDFDDPELEPTRSAEDLLAEAQKQFDQKHPDEASLLLAKARKANPNLPGLDELGKKIQARKDLDTRYLMGKDLFDRKKYDLAREAFEEVYQLDPDKYPDVSMYLGKVCLLQDKRDYAKAKQYFEIYLKRPELEDDVRRNVEWIIIGILADSEQYEEAYERFTRFDAEHHEFAINQQTYSNLRYKLWAHRYKTEIVIGLVIFIGLFLTVFLLTVVPSLRIFGGDPLERAKKAFEKKDYARVAKIADDALLRGNLPIQIRRQILEFAIRAHYALKNYFRCKDLSQELLKDFPDNELAQDHLARALLESKDTGPEAIAIYEGIWQGDPNRIEFLPLLASHYAQQKEFSEQAILVLQTWFEGHPAERETTLALAEAYCQARKMGDEVVPVLRRALEMQPDRLPWRELLARIYARKGMYAEAVAECRIVLEAGLDNMGIHVVLTTCMKKMNMLDEAILQYEQYLAKSPDNPQLTEILTELRRELEMLGSGGGGPGGLASFPVDLPPADGFGAGGMAGGDLPVPDLPVPPAPGPGEPDIDSFVEPPPEGFDPNAEELPLPDFLKESGDGSAAGGAGPAGSGRGAGRASPAQRGSGGGSAAASAGGGRAPDRGGDDGHRRVGAAASPAAAGGESGPSGGSDVDDILGGMPTMDPFASHDDGPVPSPPPAPSRSDGPGPGRMDRARSAPPVAGAESGPAAAGSGTPPPTAASPAPGRGGSGGDADVSGARAALLAGRYDDAIARLAPVFATNRANLGAGLVLTDAYLAQGKPDLAREIIESMQFDREILIPEMKDALYRVGVALEEMGDGRGALAMYDVICNVDINFKDVFDRSDRLYKHR